MPARYPTPFSRTLADDSSNELASSLFHFSLIFADVISDSESATSDAHSNNDRMIFSTWFKSSNTRSRWDATSLQCVDAAAFALRMKFLRLDSESFLMSVPWTELEAGVA